MKATQRVVKVKTKTKVKNNGKKTHKVRRRKRK